MIMLKRRILSLKRTTFPPIVTHNMIDDANDAILNHIRRLQLFNSPEDRVKIVFHPEFICKKKMKKKEILSYSYSFFFFFFISFE